MKRTAFAALGVFLFALPAQAEGLCQAHKLFAVAVHGGEFNQQIEGTARLTAMQTALEKARSELAAGKASLEVVQEIVRGFEDSGVFNTGRGAIADEAGIVETDAAIMDGNGLRSGAVASMTRIKNPVAAARLVMEAGRHVLMVGDRGQAYVEKLGAETVPESYFLNAGKRAAASSDPHGTVGAVALDRCGHMAAATSTGGFDAKAPGRVGDSPLVGDGVYAADGVAAFSATGHGEFFIRFNIAKDVSDRMRYGRQPLSQAMKGAIFGTLKPIGGEGGLIGIDAHGHVGMAFNSLGMFRGYATDREAPVVAQYAGPVKGRKHR